MSGELVFLSGIFFCFSLAKSQKLLQQAFLLARLLPSRFKSSTQVKVFISTTFTHAHTCTCTALHCTALHFTGKLLCAKGWETEREKATFLRPALDVMNVFNLRCLFLVVVVVLVAFLVESTLLLILLLQCLHAARSTPSIHLQFPLTRNLHTHPKGF